MQGITRSIAILIGCYAYCLFAAAGEIHVSSVTANNQPLKDTVIALLPEKPTDYNGHPTASIDQHNKLFVPAVLAIRVNTQVRFPNSDDIRHHVYSFSPAKKFELRLYHGMTAEPVLFDKPGQVVLGCNIHDSMVGYIYVLETEYFAVTDDKGMAQLNNIPPGNYQLAIYHPRLTKDYPIEKIVLTGQQRLTKNIQLQALPDAAQQKKSDEFRDLF